MYFGACIDQTEAILAATVTASVGNTSETKDVLKEGLLEKKGHNAGFFAWPKRFVKVTKGELYYAKPDEKEVGTMVLFLSPSLSLNYSCLESYAFLLLVSICHCRRVVSPVACMCVQASSAMLVYIHTVYCRSRHLFLCTQYICTAVMSAVGGYSGIHAVLVLFCTVNTELVIIPSMRIFLGSSMYVCAKNIDDSGTL